MKVAHFIQRYPPALGGSEAYFARLSGNLRDHGHHVSVWTSTAIDLPAFWDAGYREMRPGCSLEGGIEIRRYQPSHWFARKHLLKLVSYLPVSYWQSMCLPCNPISLRMLYDAIFGDVSCDLVHAGAFPYGWLLGCGWQLARRQKVPYFITPFMHVGDLLDPRDETRRQYTRPGLRVLLQAAERVFVQSPSEAEIVRACGVPADRVVLQGLGVDVSECTGGSRERSRAKWGVTDQEVLIGHLANQSREKGTVDLLEASLQAWRAGQRFRVVLAGPQMPNFCRYWQAFPAKQQVIQLGRVSDEEKRDFFAGIDGFAMPSRSDSFGLVFLEAWANRLPVIGYRAGGVTDLIRHGEDGYLIPCGDLDGLAEALRALVMDPLLRFEMGRMGQSRLDKEFRWEDKLGIIRAAMGEKQRSVVPSIGLSGVDGAMQ